MLHCSGIPGLCDGRGGAWLEHLEQARGGTPCRCRSLLVAVAPLGPHSVLFHPSCSRAPLPPPGVPVLTSDPEVHRASPSLLPTAFDPALPSLLSKRRGSTFLPCVASHASCSWERPVDYCTQGHFTAFQSHGFSFAQIHSAAYLPWHFKHAYCHPNAELNIHENVGNELNENSLRLPRPFKPPGVRVESISSQGPERSPCFSETRAVHVRFPLPGGGTP